MDKPQGHQPKQHKHGLFLSININLLVGTVYQAKLLDTKIYFSTITVQVSCYSYLDTLIALLIVQLEYLC